MKPHFEYWKSDNGQWYFRARAGNGKIVAQSEGYTRKANCLNGIKAVCVATGGRIIEVNE